MEKKQLLSILVVIAMLATTVLGDTIILHPNNQGNYSQWTNYNCDADAFEWQCVDEFPASTADNLFTNSKDKNESFVFQDTGLTNELINNVTLYFYGQRYSGSKYIFQSLIRSNNTDFLGSAHNLISSYAYYSQVYVTNPATGFPWTIIDVNNLEAGMKSGSNNGGGRIAQIYALVDYSHPDSCQDSDGGNTISLFGFVAGYLNDIFYSNSDYCADNDNVIEFSCNGTNKQSQQQNCGYDGYGGSNYYCIGNSVYRNYTDYSCGNGACDSNSSALWQQDCLSGQYCSNGQCLWSNSCNDNDGGFVPTVLGNVTGNYNGSFYSYSDYCISNTSLMEYYCSGNFWNRWNASCAGNGTTVCLNGRCM